VSPENASLRTLEYRDSALWLIDQTRLPSEEVVIECRTVDAVAEAIAALRVRGAPAIGCAAAYGVAIGALTLAESNLSYEGFIAGVQEGADRLRRTRPTASNLFWAIDRAVGAANAAQGSDSRVAAGLVLREAHAIQREDEEANAAMSQHGAGLIADGADILTHCNTGPLATSAVGTALGAIIAAHNAGKRVHVWVDETRPLLQGARLTTWELKQAGVPFTLITDNMAAHFMAAGKIDVAFVGADRIAANGDTANKIGTYGAAVLASAHGLPFYVIAPTSTIDLETASGADIPIEERMPEEVTTIAGKRIAPEGINAANPAFDVTPARYVTGIVTERGIVRPPFSIGLMELLGHRVEV
jgi:methylthioribose-1-phosphate isomerase